MVTNASDRRMKGATGRGSSEDLIEVSIIVSAFNDENSVCTACDEISWEMERAGFSFEILFVDDGSTDATWVRIKNLALKDKRIRGIRHRTEFGKASALANGFTYARGEVLVTCDAGVLYEPRDIVRVIDKALEGWDVVCTYPTTGAASATAWLSSKSANAFARLATGIRLRDMNSGLKAFRRQAADDMVKYGYGELHRYFVVLAAKRGYTVTDIAVEAPKPASGGAAKRRERRMRGALDFLTVLFLAGYGESPLHLMGGLGVWSIGAGTAVFAYLAYSVFVLQRSILNAPLLVVGALLLIAGVQLLVFGLLAEMINGLERHESAGSKIAQVLHIDRRSSVFLAPGVQVERRRSEPPPEPLHFKQRVGGDPKVPTGFADFDHDAS